MEPETSFFIAGLVASLGSILASGFLALASRRARQDRLAQLELDAQAMLRQIAKSATPNK